MTFTPDLTETLLRPLLRTDPHRPRLTWYGGEPAGRTELSTASLANWSAKTAGLLLDELGVAPGAGVRVLGMRSWQVLPAALGSWWAGLSVDLTPAGAGFADAVFLAPDADPDGLDALVDDSDPDTVLSLTTHPLALPVGDLPAGVRDYSTAVRAHADRFPGVPVEPTAVVLHADPPLGGDAATVTDVVGRARAMAAAWGPQPRVLAELGVTVRSTAELVIAAVAALAVDGSLVVVDPTAGFAATTVGADEQITASRSF